MYADTLVSFDHCHTPPHYIKRGTEPLKDRKWHKDTSIYAEDTGFGPSLSTPDLGEKDCWPPSASSIYEKDLYEKTKS